MPEADDHIRIAVDIMVRSVEGQCPPRRRVPAFDRNKTSDPECVAKFKLIMSEAPLVPWSVDVDTHFGLVRQQWLDAAVQAFPLDIGKGKRASWIHKDTWALIRAMAAVRHRACRQLGSE